MHIITRQKLNYLQCVPEKVGHIYFFTTTLAIAGYSNVNVQERLTSDNQSVTYVSSVSLSH